MNTLTKQGIVQRRYLKEHILQVLTQLSAQTVHRYSAEFSTDLKLARLEWWDGSVSHLASEVMPIEDFKKMVEALNGFSKRERGSAH